MNDSELHAWIRAWADTYPSGDDEVLTPIAGLEELNREQLSSIVKWKIEPRWQPTVFKSLAQESDEFIAATTRQAFSCNEDLGAFLILQELKGVGAALASAILMAHDQSRYTVMDVWAISSLCWLGGLPPDAQVSSATWLPYLQACQEISQRTGETLRVVDRALYAGRGKPLPGGMSS